MSELRSVVPDVPTDNVTAERWLAVIEPLRSQEDTLRRFAERHGLELLGNSRWPELRLRRRSLLVVGEVRVSLVPEALEQPHTHWVVRAVKYPRFPRLLGHRSSAADVAILSEADIRAGVGLEDHIRSAIGLLDTLQVVQQDGR